MPGSHFKGWYQKMVLMADIKTHIDGKVTELTRTCWKLKGMYEVDKAMTDEGWRLIQTWLRIEADELELEAKSYQVESRPIKEIVNSILDNDVIA